MPHLRLLLLLLLAALPLAADTETEVENPGDPAIPAIAEPPPQLGYREAVILGVVEGITEYLPISSTGHLLLTNQALGLNNTTPLRDDSGQLLRTADGRTVTLKQAADAYAIIIQGGAILAVLFLYWRRIYQVVLGVLGLNPIGRRLARNLILAFLPAAVLGLILNDWIESLLFAPLPIAIALAAGGVLMLAIERWRSRQTMGGDDVTDLHTIGIRQSLLIGFLQCVAMWPGTSRSMMTIVGGYLAGLPPAKAAEFSFLLGLITLSAAAGYKAVSTGPALLLAVQPGPLLLGIFVAFLAAALAVKWLVAYLSRHGLALFAYYRFLLAGLVFLFLI